MAGWNAGKTTKSAYPGVAINRSGRSGYVLRCCSILLALVFSGCINRDNTRLPQVATWFPQAENRAYQRQSPFPDPDIGPSTDSIPRGYEIPRTLPQRSAEERMMRGIPVGPESIAPGVPQGGLARPRAVY